MAGELPTTEDNPLPVQRHFKLAGLQIGLLELLKNQSTLIHDHGRRFNLTLVLKGSVIEQRYDATQIPTKDFQLKTGHRRTVRYILFHQKNTPVIHRVFTQDSGALLLNLKLGESTDNQECAYLPLDRQGLHRAVSIQKLLRAGNSSKK